MNEPALSPRELALISGVFKRHPAIMSVKLFGSRAKGTHSPASDVDLAVWGEISDLNAESIAADLDELPLPYKFEVKPFSSIRLPALREHIERVGIEIYSAAQTTAP